MHEGASFVSDLAIVLVVAALTSVLSRLLRQPSVLGYLVAGLVVGPYTPLPIFADLDRVEALSEFGVVLVMFAVGLELRVGRLAKVLPLSGLTALVQIATLMWAGFSVGRLVGWSTVESLFLGGCVSISSTMVVSKVMGPARVVPAIREHVFGVLVLQDVAAVALIAALTAVAAGQGLSASDLAVTVGRLGAVLVGLVVVGMLVVPRAVRAVVRLESSELWVVVVVGTCFGFAYLAQLLGYSVALGAFVAGVLVAESGRGEETEHLVAPLKDVFAAVFFVSVGMTVDPALAWQHGGVALLVAGVVLAGQFISVTVAGTLSGVGLRRSVLAGLALGQIGEFAFVIAAIGIGGGVVRPELQPIVVTVAVVTAFTTPLLLGASGHIIHWVDGVMPHRVQTMLVVYESWFERLRTRGDAGRTSRMRRIVTAIALDGVALVALAVATRVADEDLKGLFHEHLGLSSGGAELAVLVGALALAAPLLVALLRSTRALGAVLSESVIGVSTLTDARAAVMRRLFAAATQLIVVLGVGLPLAAALRPFLPAPYALPVVLALALLMAAGLWRVAGGMAGEVKSGASQLLELLARQSGQAEAVDGGPSDLLPGLEDVVDLTLPPGAYAVDKTLAELDLRARTGASVVALHREGYDVSVPTGHERLAEGDLLALAGRADTVERARVLLFEGP